MISRESQLAPPNQPHDTYINQQITTKEEASRAKIYSRLNPIQIHDIPYIDETPRTSNNARRPSVYVYSSTDTPLPLSDSKD